MALAKRAGGERLQEGLHSLKAGLSSVQKVTRPVFKTYVNAKLVNDLGPDAPALLGEFRPLVKQQIKQVAQQALPTLMKFGKKLL
jgi:hypothetical protein